MDRHNVIGYVRVSTEEQAQSGAGLAAQRAAILDEAHRRGWNLIEIVEDAGWSAKDLRRPGISAALAALHSKRADVLVVSKVDRLSRSLLDFAGLVDRATREHWALVALDLGVDSATPSGRMMANVLATFAQFERDLISQRTKDALAQKKAQGVKLGRHVEMSEEVRARIVAEREAEVVERVGVRDDGAIPVRRKRDEDHAEVRQHGDEDDAGKERGAEPRRRAR